MIPSITLYHSQPIEVQVKMQIGLVRHYAEDWMDMPSFSEKHFREAIKHDMERDLLIYEQDEKYELCSVYRDAIENIKWISLKLLL